MSKEELSKIQVYETKTTEPETPKGARVKQSGKPGAGVPFVGIAIGIVVTTIVLMASHPASVSLGSISSGTGSSNDIAPPTALAALKAKGADGISIDMNGVSNSDSIIISEYYPDGYTTKLQCTVDSLPVYCDGSPFSITGLPDGRHTITIGTFGDATSHGFSWIVS